MRLLVFSDLQATDGGEVCYHDPSVKLQDWRVKRFFEFLEKAHKERQCDGLVDLGDLTDDRSAIPVPTINTVCEGLSRFPTQNNFKLIGNHEQFTRSTEIHVGRLFEPFFAVISRACIQRLGDLLVFLCPYPQRHDELAKWIEAKCQKYRNKRKILFGHFQVAGSITKSGTLLEGISPDLLVPFELSLLGHVHKPQALGNNAHYVGSPFQQDWGEAGESKRVAILDTDSLQLEWIPVTGFPSYHTVSVAEFVEALENDSGEDRFKVIVQSPDEAQIIYTHPQGTRAQPHYAYAAQEAEIDADPSRWTLDAVLKRWMKVNPWTVDITSEDMLAIGLRMARGEV